MFSRIVGVSILLLMMLGVAARANIVGLPPDGLQNCAPFGCTPYGNYPGTFYQQIYSSSAFSAPLMINSLSFYNTNPYWTNQTFNSMTFSIYLSTTGVAVNAIDGRPYTSNLGADNALFWSGSIGGAFPFGSVLSFAGTPFYYDPGQGNLLMTILVSSLTEGGAWFDARNGTATDFSRWDDWGPVGFDNYGLVTGFNEANAPIPEPGSLVLLGSGLLWICGTVRRKLSL